jgi:hypothetical protein
VSFLAISSIPNPSALTRAAASIFSSCAPVAAAASIAERPVASCGSQIQPFSPRSDQLRGSATTAHDHRHSHRERFEGRVRERVVKSGKDKAIGRGIERPHIVDATEQLHALANARSTRLRVEARRIAIPSCDDESHARVARARERVDCGAEALALESRSDECEQNVLVGATECASRLGAQRHAMARMEVLQVDAVVDDVQLLAGDAEMARDVCLHHPRVANHRAQPRMLEEVAFDLADVAVIRIRAHLRPREARGLLQPVFEPLAVHAIAGAVDVASSDALVRLHEVEALARPRGARGAREARIAPKASDVRRIYADDSP